ncbi:MAG: glycosyltransferase [Verrucomicrobiota bacterium]
MVDSGDGEEKPLVVSLCGTYLKAEMQSIYRQIANLSRHRTVVFAERVENLESFPFEPVVEMEKRSRPRYRGNFLLRFWYKHVVRKWPPPRPIGHVGMEGAYYEPYDLADLLREWKPALVHVYYGHKAVKYRRMLAASGVPYVVSFHGVDVVKFMDDPEYVRELGLVFEEAELVMARSESLLAKLEMLGCSRDKLRLNRTPIPFDSFPFRRREVPSDGEWRVVQACRLIAKKGLMTVLSALPAVVGQRPKLRYTICGRGPMEDELRARIEREGLGEHVRLAGWVDQEALKAIYGESHVFLHPSEVTESSDQEGVPNSMLEAMACGLPVVATRHGGIPEAMEDGKDGFLVAEKSPDEIADALLRLTGDGDALGRYSEHASDTVRERFGFAEQIACLENWYEEALEKVKGRERCE